MKYKSLSYNKNAHPSYWRTLNTVLNSKEFYDMYEFVQVLTYENEYVFTILVKEKA